MSADKTVACDFAYDINNLAKDFGTAEVKDNCAVPDPIETRSVNLNSCRIGTITRTFTARERRWQNSNLYTNHYIQT